MNICKLGNSLYINNTAKNSVGANGLNKGVVGSANCLMNKIELNKDTFSFCGTNAVKSKKNILVDAIRNSIEPAVKKKDVPLILSSLGFDISVDKDGLVSINGSYDSRHVLSDIGFADLGIDENMILAKIKRIDGNCSINPSKVVKKTGALQEVSGDFYGTNVKNYENLKYIGGNAFFADDVHDYKISSPLQVHGIAYFSESLDRIDNDNSVNNPIDSVSASEIVSFTL